MPQKIRPIRVEGNIAFVALTHGYEAIIDAADVPLVQGFNWTAKMHGRTVYAVRTASCAGGKRRKVYLHRVIMGEPKSLEVDHISGDGLNCTKLNLRCVTRAENTRNRRRMKATISGLKGSHWRKDVQRWTSSITSDGRSYHLGYFNTREEAHAAYCEASARLHGEFGRTE